MLDRYVYISGGPAGENPYGQFIRGQNALSINDALPLVSLASTVYDKRVFGVLSPDVFETSPSMLPLTYTQKKRLVECGDVRMQVNAMGDGCIWVTDINGSFLSGDLITSSTIPEYGQLQTGDLPLVFQAYTVTKITCDCDFSTLQQPQYRVMIDEQGLNVLDGNGQLQWIQNSVTIMVDPITGLPSASTSLPVMGLDGTISEPIPTQTQELNLVPLTNYLTESKYKMRWLRSDGTQLTKAEYDLDKSQGVPVYKVAFVWCTYYSG